jgi:diguanylate cyclase (GGDEF)-like protein
MFGRQDALLLAGLAAALLIAFAQPISRALDYAREVEDETGLTLLPALVVLTAVYLFHQLRKREEVAARASAAETARREAERRALQLERLVGFGQALSRSLDLESIRAVVAQHLARVAEAERVWVLLRHGTGWEALAGDTRGAEDVIEREGLADRVIGSAARAVGSSGTIGVPLVAGGSALGVLGLMLPSQGSLTPDQERVVEAAAALLAVSLKNAQLFREVRENSLRDGLTGCATRAHGEEVIDAELRRARRSQMPVSLIMFDLDHFKDINDRYGHLCGDAVLAAVGRRMREVLRGSDVKCRYGGEEFLVLLPETPLGGARRVAETLRREIAERPIPWAGEALTVTASFGIAQVLPGEIDLPAILQRADAALYRAKQDGRNCVRVAGDTLALLDERRR